MVPVRVRSYRAGGECEMTLLADTMTPEDDRFKIPSLLRLQKIALKINAVLT